MFALPLSPFLFVSLTGLVYPIPQPLSPLFCRLSGNLMKLVLPVFIFLLVVLPASATQCLCAGTFYSDVSCSNSIMSFPTQYITPGTCNALANGIYYQLSACGVYTNWTLYNLGSSNATNVTCSAANQIATFVNLIGTCTANTINGSTQYSAQTSCPVTSGTIPGRSPPLAFLTALLVAAAALWAL
jgi:hypothetical protein